MRNFLCALAVAVLAMSMAMAVPVFAQTNPSSETAQPTQMASAKSGNTIIESGGASNADLNVARYKAWDDFRSDHPEVARELRHNPRLADSSHFLNRHPQLKQLFESNAGMQNDMTRNPGNYLAGTGHHRHHHRATNA